MIIGNPYKFAIIVNVINEWNPKGDTWRNGVLLFSVDGELFTKELHTAVLNSEIQPLKEKLMNITINEEIYNMEKEQAYFQMEKIRFPYSYNPDAYEDYQYDI